MCSRGLSLRAANSPFSPNAGWFGSSTRRHRTFMRTDAGDATMCLPSFDCLYFAYTSFARFTSSPHTRAFT